MNAPAAFPTVPVTVKTVDADTVFAALADPTRRRILQALSDRVPRTATKVQHITGKRHSATIKQLTALRDAGLLISTPDKDDGRRQAYSLPPSIPVGVSEDGRKTVDFGYCLLRF